MTGSPSAGGSRKSPYNQPSLTVPQQIGLLRQKGLQIGDEEAATHWLSHISYFRFKNYSYSFKDYQKADGNYLPGTDFEQILELYLFDRKLKLIVFEAIENIEVAVKTVFTNTLAQRYGPHWYLEAGHFYTAEERRKENQKASGKEDLMKAFSHNEFLKTLEEDCEQPQEIFLEHYVRNYQPKFPPSWMLMEIITFGTFSLMFENLKSSEEKTAICEHFDLTKKHLTSWLHTFTFIRNRCVHHARLVYVPVKIKPALPQKRSRQFLAEADAIDNALLYAVLCCIQQMLRICNNRSPFRENLLALYEEFPNLDYVRMGFTPAWRSEKIWNA